MKEITVLDEISPMEKLAQGIARICSLYCWFFGQVSKITLSLFKLVSALMSKRRWCMLWACLEGLYIFRHWRRCDATISQSPKRNTSA